MYVSNCFGSLEVRCPLLEDLVPSTSSTEFLSASNEVTGGSEAPVEASSFLGSMTWILRPASLIAAFREYELEANGDDDDDCPMEEEDKTAGETRYESLNDNDFLGLAPAVFAATVVRIDDDDDDEPE